MQQVKTYMQQYPEDTVRVMGSASLRLDNIDPSRIELHITSRDKPSVIVSRFLRLFPDYQPTTGEYKGVAILKGKDGIIILIMDEQASLRV